ncbi:MAG: 4Fe-4S binding protein [Candidatus Methanosuratincola sp.]
MVDAPLSKATEGAGGLTGMWRIKRPEVDSSRCTKCHLCWLFCPEGVVRRGSKGEVWVVYEFCKGCGICAEVCTPRAISMVREV